MRLLESSGNYRTIDPDPSESPNPKPHNSAGCAYRDSKTTKKRSALLATTDDGVLQCTHRSLNRSFLGLPYRILNINHKKELLRGLWVRFRLHGAGLRAPSRGFSVRAFAARVRLVK